MRKLGTLGAAGMLALGLLSNPVWADGGISDGGGDSFTLETGAAWFLNVSRAVQVCYEAAPDFGYPQQGLESAIREAFATWTAYVQKKKINARLGGWFAYAARLAFLPQCDGTEDLKFYLGTEDATVGRHKARFENPTGFAVRTQYQVDGTNAWGKGYIWLAKQGSVNLGPNKPSHPNWMEPKAFTAMLLHEFGHVFGCEHVAETIMRPDIAAFIVSDPWTRERRLADFGGRIDHARELVSCYECDFKLIRTGSSPQDFPVLSLEEIFGVRPSETAEVTYEGDGPLWGFNVGRHYLVLRDGAVTVRREIHLNAVNSITDSAALFKNPKDFGTLHTVAAIGNGYVDADDRLVPLFVEYNFSGGDMRKDVIVIRTVQVFPSGAIPVTIGYFGPGQD